MVEQRHASYDVRVIPGRVPHDFSREAGGVRGIGGVRGGGFGSVSEW